MNIETAPRPAMFIFEILIRLLIKVICAVVLTPVVLVISFPVVLVLACFGTGSYWVRVKQEYRIVFRWWKEQALLYLP